MKKLLTLFLALTCATSLFADNYDCKIDGIYYELDEANMTATVTYKEWEKPTYSGSIVIPNTISYHRKKYSVTKIGSYAFKDCEGLTSVTIPNSVTTIGSGAFENCEGLKKTNYTGSIADWCKIEFGSFSITENHNFFINDVEVKDLVIPNSVTSIGEGAFMHCSGLTSVTIPNSVTSIGERAFYGCNGLTSVTIPNSVTCIGSAAFAGCSGLTSVTIPNSVTKIGSFAFSGCSGLTSVTIPNSVTTIGKHAFHGCSGLTSVTIPNSVTSIGEEAFYDCNGLTSVTIPNSVTSIEERAFWSCDGLTSVTIPNSVTTIGKHAFHGCSGLTSVTIPNSVTSIEEGAFMFCFRLKSITIPNSVTKIGKEAFMHCSRLKSVTIPNSVTSIGEGAFADCSNLTSVTIPNSVTSIGERAFAGCSDWSSGLTSITIPKSVTKIEKEAFNSCSNLKDVFVASKSIHINPDSFKGCYIKNVYCAASVKLPSFGRNTQIHILSDDELFLLTPFSEYAQEYVEPRINEWQKKGDFEKVADWQKRVNETTRRQKASELLKEAQKKYLAIYTKENKTFTLGTYDSENEVFLIKGSNTGDLLVSVPINDAQYVQQNWSSHTATPHYAFAGTDIVAESVDFTFPNNRTYTYHSSQNLTYAQADIQYNFDPIDLNSGFNTGSSQPKGQQTIQQTQLVIGKSDVDTDIPTTGKSSPNTFAVIISNENYTKLKEVPCAINDGEVFAQYCEKTIGLPKDNIRLYTNATYGMMIEAVRNMRNIANAYNGDINIIFYYSGHGAPIDDTKEAYLLPVDAFGVSPEVCYSLNRLYKELADMKAKSVTMFLDACFSGATKDGDMLASVRGVAIKAKANAPQGNMVVFSAASDEQTALPYLDMGHGLFTYFLLKKLQDTKGDVTYQELGDYVKQEVYRRSSVKGKAQTPTISASATAEGWQEWKLR